MTLTLLNIDNQHQIIVSIIFNDITKEFRVITESTTDEEITAFICNPESLHFSFIEALFKNAAPVLIKSQDGKFWMTTIFLDINDEIYIIKSLTYNITTKSYKIDTEKLETWEKVTFFVLQSLQSSLLSKANSRILPQQWLLACATWFE